MGFRHRRLVKLQALVLGTLVAVCGCQLGGQQETADMVLVGGRVITVDEALPEVEAVAVRGDRVAATGTSEEISRLIGPKTRVIDLQGALVVPGLIEAHAHFLGIGQALLQLDLSTAGSWPEVVEMVAAAVAEAEPGQWILGRGWHQDKWRSPPQPQLAGLPYHDDLSAVSSDNPVRLTHASGHSAIVNGKAMALAGITAETADPAGGEIVRDATGRPIGVLRETAMDLLTRDQQWSEVTERRKVELAAERCLANGITTVHDAGTSFREVELYRTMAEQGELGIRLWVMLGEPNNALAEQLASYRIVGAGNHHLTVGGIKRLADGALGSHGAWLLAPYRDQPGSTGLNTYPMPQLAETARLAAANHLQLCVHAIGDRANRETLDLYEQALSALPDGRDRRWRIEHAQHLDSTDIPRFAELGVIASMQPVHCTSDGSWVESRLGAERTRTGAYAWRALLDSGALICSGTDAPVEPVDPIATFHAAISRRLADGSQLYPEQAMTREEALRSMTIDAAYAAFEEQLKGSIQVGKLADLTVLSQDIMQVPEEQIPATRVLYTIVGGKVLYRSDAAQATGR